MNRNGGELAYKACKRVLTAHSQQIDMSGAMIVQLFDSNKKNWKNLKNTLVFSYPEGASSNVHMTCKVDMRTNKIIDLFYKKQSIIENVAEELRTF